MSSQAQPHRVGIVRYADQVHAWVLDLPGCIAGAATVADLDNPVRLAIAEHLGWRGERVASTDWEVAEEVDGESLAPTGGEFCFGDDRRPLSRGEMAASVALLERARRDLIAATEPLSAQVWDWAPPPSAFGRFDAWAPEVRTIRDVMRHVLELEVYYRAGLRDGPAAGIFEPVGAPREELEKTVGMLHALDSEALSRSYWPQRPGRETPEEWTARKTIRRLISHERAHTAEIWQRRAWVLLGTPSGPPHS